MGRNPLYSFCFDASDLDCRFSGIAGMCGGPLYDSPLASAASDPILARQASPSSLLLIVHDFDFLGNDPRRGMVCGQKTCVVSHLAAGYKLGG
jgi:hypothetical protein